MEITAEKKRIADSESITIIWTATDVGNTERQEVFGTENK